MKFDAVYSGISNQGRSSGEGGGKIGRRINIFNYKNLFNPLNPELNPICYLLALLTHHFLHVDRIRVKSLSFRLLMSYIYIYIYIYIWSAYS